jgi:hypothetical protein
LVVPSREHEAERACKQERSDEDRAERREVPLSQLADETLCLVAQPFERGRIEAPGPVESRRPLRG